MKKRRIVSLLLTVAVMIAQFSVSGGVSAASTALSGRTDFAMGVNIHRAQNYAAYMKSSAAIADARALGANYIRTNNSGNESYDRAVVKLAEDEGMKVLMTCSLGYWNSSSNSAIPADEIDVEGITSSFTTLATNLKGKVEYYQIGNEMSIEFLKGNIAGKYTTDYNDVSGVAVAIYAANKAIKTADPDAKTIVNFTWFHYGFLDAVKLVNIDSRTGKLATSSTPSKYITHADWDIIGFDWYAGGGVPENTYIEIIERMLSVFPDKTLIVCEANVIAKSSTDGETVVYNDTPAWMENFIRYCYTNHKVEGFFIYELYDEPAYANRTGTYVFNRESHFGLLDKYGNKKEMYEKVRALYGGTGAASALKTPTPLTAGDNAKNFVTYEMCFGCYGSDAVTDSWFPGWSGWNHSFVQFQSEANLTAYDFIEFDYYVYNLANFKARGIKVTVGLMHYSGGRVRYADFTPYLTKDGWNHVKVPVVNFSGDEWISDRAQQIRFLITMPASETAALDTYSITNVAATMEGDVTVPEMQATEGMYTLSSGKTFSGRLGTSSISNGWLPGCPYSQIDFTRCDLTVYDYLEFDYYVKDIDKFKARTTMLNCSIVHYSGATEHEINLFDYLTESGWNHIKIPITEFITSGREWVIENAGNLRFKTDVTESSENANLLYIVANICFTVDQADIIPVMKNRYTTLDSIAGSNHTMTLTPGENPYRTAKGYFKLSRALDTSVADYIEMDIYVSADTDAKPVFWVSDNRESGRPRGKYTVPLLKSGWNHIVLDAFDTVGTYGTGYSFRGYNFVFPFFEKAFFSSSHSTGGTVRVANISVTCEIVAPTDISNEGIGLSNIETCLITFDENGMYDFDFGDSRNISDTKMLELDVFVTNSIDDNVAIELMDSDGNYSDYAFTWLTVGWNHLAVRVADLRQSAENTENVNLSDIAYLTLYGNANNKVIVSNLYAADYVEGDANRDGEFNLKDIVRAKKMAAGVTTEGNKLAVSGDDYEINALDLTNLVRSIIDALFK